MGYDYDSLILLTTQQTPTFLKITGYLHGVCRSLGVKSAKNGQE